MIDFPLIEIKDGGYCKFNRVTVSVYTGLFIRMADVVVVGELSVVSN